MIVIITQSNRASHNLATITKEQEATLFETMLSYSGKVILTEANKGYFDIDVSYNQTWTGEKQNREFIIKDDMLQIVVGPQIGINGKNITAIMSWDKV